MTFFKFSQIFGLESMETLNRSSNIPKLTVLKVRNPRHQLKFLIQGQILVKIHEISPNKQFITVQILFIQRNFMILTGIWIYIKNLSGARGFSPLKLLILVYYYFCQVFPLIPGRRSGKIQERSYCSNPTIILVILQNEQKNYQEGSSDEMSLHVEISKKLLQRAIKVHSQKHLVKILGNEGHKKKNIGSF